MRRHATAGLVIPILILASACGGSTAPGSPSALVPPISSLTLALSGSVQDADNNNAVLPGATVEVTSGPDAGRSTVTDNAGNYTLTNLALGAFAVQFSRNGYQNLTRTVSASQDTRLDVQLRRGPTCGPLGTPTNFRVDVAGSTVTFSWNPVATASDYLLGVGTSPGSSRTRSTNTSQTGYVWRGMPSGQYYARVVARDACTRSNASNEVAFTVGS
jgi:hypothetical protein